MEFNRNQYFLLGLILLFLGLQFRMVDSIVLNEKSSRFLTEKLGTKTQAKASEMFQTAGMGSVVPRRVVRPPKWLGWCLIAMGGVLVLHSLALKRPG